MSSKQRKQLNRLNITRDALRSGLRKVVSDIPSDNLSHAKLVGIRNDIETKLRKVSSMDDQILDIIDEDDIEKDIEETCSFESEIQEALARVENLLKKDDDVASCSGGSSTTSKAKVKLPKLELKKFDGKSVNWLAFWDQFKSSVHDNDELSSIDKFSYLRSLLCASALDSIRGLNLTATNYANAIQVLQERYGSTQVLISSHMEQFVKLARVRDTSNVGEIRKLYDHVEAGIRNLASLGIPSESYGQLLIPMLFDKFPDELRLTISRKFSNEQVWSLDTLMEIFKEELQAKERCSFVGTNRPTGTRTHEKRREDDYTTQGLHTNTRNSLCVYCRGDHPSSHCTTCFDLQTRKIFLRQNGRCFICLKGGHRIRDCKLKYRCNNCGSTAHHISICEKTAPSSDNTPPPPDNPPIDTTRPVQDTNENTAMYIHNTEGILLQTGTATVRSTTDYNKKGLTRILFDGGSQRTYVTESLRNDLKLKTIRREKIVVKRFGSLDGIFKVADVVQLCVQGKTNGLNIFIEAIVTPIICAPIQNQYIDFAMNSYPHLQGLELADHSDGRHGLEISILVGSDYYYSFMTGTIRRGSHGPVALNSCLGWVLAGPMKRNGHAQESCSNVITTHSLFTHQETNPMMQDGIRNDLRLFWEIENIPDSSINDEVLTRFEHDLYFNGSRYVTKLPLKPNQLTLEDNYGVSFSRLSSLRRKLQRDSDLSKNYHGVINDYLEQGIIEVVPDGDKGENGMVHYLPHRAVIREDKSTTKTRIVFDGSAKSKDGPSLNDVLYSGPSLIPKIYDILLRFRIKPVGIIADIKQAFLNIEVHPNHVNLLRFLWWDDLSSDNPKIIVMRFLRVMFGLTSSPFLLGATIKHHVEQYLAANPDFVERFLRDLYVDDSTSSLDTDSEAIEFYKNAKRIMSEAGFDIRKWASNDRVVTEHLKACNEIKETDPNPKVLGIEWKTNEDIMVFNFEDILSEIENLPPTKRSVLRIGAKLFDPLGLMSPITATIKCLFQMLCEDQGDWDDLMPETVRPLWEKWTYELKQLKMLSWPRYLFRGIPELIQSVELHGFCDSSKKVYASAIYLRAETSSGIIVRLLTAKAKVAPLKKTSIPRLELLAAVSLAELRVVITSALENCVVIDREVFWSDSEIVLHWITNLPREWKQFVQNRVDRIREITDIGCWRHVPGLSNPSDIPTREVDLTEIPNLDMWWGGPDFLYENESLWPKSPSSDFNNSSVSKERKKVVTKTMSNLTLALEKDCDVATIIDFRKFSSLARLLETTIWVLRFVSNTKRRIKNKNVVKGHITVYEKLRAEQLWIRSVQRELFGRKNIDELQNTLKLFVDDKGLLRVRGRLANSSETYDRKHPVLLPRKHHFTKLIVLKCHNEVKHCGVSMTLDQVRNEYWIIKGRQTVRMILHKCFICKLIHAKPLVGPAPPDLPQYRLDEEYAFVNCGLDNAGPLYVRDIYSKSKRLHKVYVSIFVCATTRNVHLELVPNLGASACIRALTRFTSRKLTPRLYISDNFETFKSNELKNYLARNNIHWKFILEASPWWGGFYERTVRIVKDCLRKTIGKARLNFEELNTALIETERVLNCRPLSYIETDDVLDTLTPSSLLYGRRVGLKSGTSLPVKDETRHTLLSRMKHLDKVIDRFWSRFRHEYLSELRQIQAYNNRRGQAKQLSSGDVVLLVDDRKVKRNQWRLAKVNDLIVGRDGQVRGAVVRTISNDGHVSVLKRPVQKLVPLEISDNFEESSAENRPRRQTAVTGELIRRVTNQI